MKPIITKLLEQNRLKTEMLKSQKKTIANEHLKGVGRGHLTMVGGQAAGLLGNSHKVDLRRREGALVATTGVPVHRGETRRHNARGIRAKPQTNTTAGEIQKQRKPHLDDKVFLNYYFNFK